MSPKIILMAPMLLMSAHIQAQGSVKGEAAVQQGETVSAKEDKGTKLVLLGTAGGPILRTNRSQPASMLTVDGTTYLIDAGEGVSRQLVKAGRQPFDVKAIFLTHLHMDHVNGLASVLAFNWVSRRGNHISVYGPPGTQALVDAGIHYSHIPESIFELQYPPSPNMRDLVKATDLGAIASDSAPVTVYEDDKIRVTAVENSHYITIDLPKRDYGYDRSYSYRFDTGDLSVVFSGDTGPSPALTKLAQDADILVTEVIDLNKQLNVMRSYGASLQQLKPLIDHMKVEHITPEEIGKMATAARVKKVVLSHVVPGDVSETDLETYVEGVKKYYDGPVILGADLDVFRK